MRVASGKAKTAPEPAAVTAAVYFRKGAGIDPSPLTQSKPKTPDERGAGRLIVLVLRRDALRLSPALSQTPEVKACRALSCAQNKALALSLSKGEGGKLGHGKPCGPSFDELRMKTVCAAEPYKHTALSLPARRREAKGVRGAPGGKNPHGELVEPRRARAVWTGQPSVVSVRRTASCQPA
jgi:hypothetical protein